MASLDPPLAALFCRRHARISGDTAMADVTHLASGVRALRPFVPAKDFETSRRFYVALGFREKLLEDRLIEFSLGPYSFLLQDYYVAEWAGNFMMHVLVDDLDAWWTHIDSLDLPGRFGVDAPRAPKLEPWGLRVAYVIDPSDVLWHFAEVPKVRGG
jgi:catechol 2,3-dioxygenase-like lactoylglutathione lyase family enzyme